MVAGAGIPVLTRSGNLHTAGYRLPAPIGGVLASRVHHQVRRLDEGFTSPFLAPASAIRKAGRHRSCQSAHLIVLATGARRLVITSTDPELFAHRTSSWRKSLQFTCNSA